MPNAVLLVAGYVFMFLTVANAVYARHFAEDAPGWNITLKQWFTLGGKAEALLGTATLLLWLLAFIIP